MATSIHDDLSWLADECELRLRFLEPEYSVRVIVPPATTLYDPMLGWVDDDGSVVFCDIGGQREPGWNPNEGHGSLWRLHRDDTLEAIVPPGNIGKGMIMFPMQSTPSFGEYARHIFFLGQTRPGREGAHSTHAVYHVPLGSDTPEIFVRIPHVGTIGGGISGALCPSGWGAEGTPEAGTFFVHSLMNCVIYAMKSDRTIEPWLICDEDHAPMQFMPTQVFRAGDTWGELAGELIVSGRPHTTFESPAELSGALTMVYFRVVAEGSHGPQLEQVSQTEPGGADMMLARAKPAPSSFGPLGGKLFYCRGGSANLAHTTKMDDGPLPYDADIVWLDDHMQPHVFADQLQSGAPALIFQGDRMIVSVVRKSYSTGEYHYPDGSIYEITYTGS